MIILSIYNHTFKKNYLSVIFSSNLILKQRGAIIKSLAERNMAEQEIPKIENILNDYRGMILRICKAYSTDPIEPEDLFQEVIYQVWKSFNSLKGNSKISTWIYKITINVCYRTNLELKKKILKQ